MNDIGDQAHGPDDMPRGAGHRCIRCINRYKVLDSIELILDVASGRKKTCTGHWGLRNAMVLFNPGPVT